MPSFDASNYKPIATWSGRLLFDRENRLEHGAVQIEVHNAPQKKYIGQTMTLGWNFTKEDTELHNYVEFLTMDVTFGDEAKKSATTGRIHPERLDGLSNVGPLESLAAARPDNDIYVVLPEAAEPVVEGGNTILISKPPVQARGKLRCLATFVGPSAEGGDDLYDIQHYNPNTQAMDGPTETIRVPGFPKNNRGLYCSTARQIEGSPVNAFGWYLYGQVMDDGIFVVEAWEPRRALQLQVLDAAIGGVDADIDAIKNRVWAGTRHKKGTVETILLDPTADEGELDTETAVADWTEGERCLVIHLFGGIGGSIGTSCNERCHVSNKHNKLTHAIPVMHAQLTKRIQWGSFLATLPLVMPPL